MSKICPVSRPALQRASFPKERLLFFLKTCLCLVYLYIICDVRILLLLTYGMGRVSRNFTATEEASFEVDPGTTCTTCRLSTPVLLRVSHFKLLPGVVSWTLFDSPPPSSLLEFCWAFNVSYSRYVPMAPLYKSSCSNCCFVCVSCTKRQ